MLPYCMGRHSSVEGMRRDLDVVLSTINALEVSAQDEYQRGAVKVMRALTESQIHTVGEFEHIKKALDLLLQQIFELQNRERA